MTDFLSLDEPCYGLMEGHEVAPVPGALNGATEWRWIQKVFVLRGDTIAKHIRDFGPSEDFEMSTPFGLHTNPDTDKVGPILAMAERTRSDTYWQRRAQEQLEASTLITDLIEQEAKIAEVIRNRTTSGPYVTNQRNGWAREESQRRFKERRQKKKVVFLT